MLFDERPKSDPKDLFDQEQELSDFTSSLLQRRAIVITGIRRVGKSSLIRVGLSVSGLPGIYIDLRGTPISGKLSSQALISMIRDASLSLKGEASRVAEEIKGAVEELGITGLITFRLRQDASRQLLLRYFSELDRVARRRGERVVVAFDEAQLLRYSAVDIRGILANVYDNMEGVVLVLSGSEAGLLHRFIGTEDPESPLYGRYMKYITLRPFDRDRSVRFLEQGFKELSIRADPELIHEAVDSLDGVVGWLSFLGLRSAERGSLIREIIEEALGMAAKLEEKEILQLPASQLLALSAIARLESPTWADIKRMYEALKGKRVNDGELNRALSSLQSLSLVEKENGTYRVLDPVTRRAAASIEPRDVLAHQGHLRA